MPEVYTCITITNNRYKTVMPSYSSDKFYKDWVYAIDKDFQSPDGTPAQYAPGQPKYWGEEYASIPLPTAPSSSSLNADHSLIAVALENDIQIYATDGDMSLQQMLKGHTSKVDTVRFHPKDPEALVSCAMNSTGGSVAAEPAIIFWNLDKQRQRRLLSKAAVAQLGRRAASFVACDIEGLDTTPWVLDEGEEESIGQDIGKAITALNVKSQLRDNVKIHGRLSSSLGSQTFNLTGSSIAFLPGNRPRSNGDEQWDICIWNTIEKETRFTLIAHRDAIMWIGFSPDDTLIASVSWDKTFRIWSHETGSLLHTFHSNSQNWTGGFSADSRFFAGTSGEGRFWVWDLVHGIEVLTHKFGSCGRWCRTLDWSPNMKQIVIGGRNVGKVIVFDIKRQEIVQKRLLSTRECPPDVQRIAEGFLEAKNARYLPGSEGAKIVYRTSGDNGVEVYDVKENRKWRSAPAQGENKGWGLGILVLEERGLIASVDGDAIRFWEVPFCGHA